MKCGGALRAAREDGRTRRRCARCGWTFYDNPVPAVGAVVTGRAGVLLARRARPPYEGTWDIPGGFLEAGEDPERGLQRELREELGTRAAATRLLGFCHDHYGPGGFPILTVLFAVRLSGSPRARSDVAEVRWFQRDAIPWRSIAFPSLRGALRRHLGPRKTAPGPATAAPRISRLRARISTHRRPSS